MDSNDMIDALKIRALQKLNGDADTITAVGDNIFEIPYDRFRILTEEEQDKEPKICREVVEGQLFYIHRID